MSKIDFLVLGNASSHYILQVDNIPDDDTTIYITNSEFDTLFYGGTGLNIVYSLSKLGDNHNAILTSTDTKYGKIAIDALNELGVNTEYTKVIEGKAGCYIIEDQKKRRLTILGGDFGRIPATDMPNSLFENTKMCIFSMDNIANVNCFMDKLEETGIDFAFSMRSDRTIFTDDLLRRAIPRAKIIFCNEFERTIIESALAIENITEMFDKGKVEIICVTQGAKGSIIYTKDCMKDGVLIAASKPDKIEDCTGAGDGFVAGFMYGYSQGMKPTDCAKLGATLSSFIIEKMGCVSGSPTKEQLFERYYQREDVRKEK